jgi:hypothetical protein
MLSSKISTHLLKHSHRSKLFAVFHCFDVTRSRVLNYNFCKVLIIKRLILSDDEMFSNKPKRVANLFKLLPCMEMKFVELGGNKLIFGTGE